MQDQAGDHPLLQQQADVPGGDNTSGGGSPTAPSDTHNLSAGHVCPLGRLAGCLVGW